MIRIDGLRLELDFTQEDLRRAAAKKLRLPQWALAQVKLAKKSVDARKKEDVHFVCAVDAAVDGDEDKLLRRAGGRSPTSTGCPRDKPWTSPLWWWGWVRRGCSRGWCWPSAACALW